MYVKLVSLVGFVYRFAQCVRECVNISRLFKSNAAGLYMAKYVKKNLFKSHTYSLVI